jgi:hypothetical protein
VGSVPILSVTPAVLLPEVQPYITSGQLTAALATPRDGAAWRATRAEEAEPTALADEPRAVAVLVGLLVAVTLLAQGIGRRALAALRGLRTREAA